MSGFATHAPLAYERVVYPCHSMNCGDMIYRSTLDPALRMEGDGISPITWFLAALAFIYLTAAPGVLQGAIDAFVREPFIRFTQGTLTREDVEVGRKLATGGFGTVYLGKALRTVPGKVHKGQTLVVKKAIEFGEAEVWMNERLTRAAPAAIAPFLAAYPDGSSRLGAPLVLVWKYAGDLTLYDALQARDFPRNVEAQILGRPLNIGDPIQRDLVTIKVIAQQILRNLAALHATGIVHRDIKPQNMVLSGDAAAPSDNGSGGGSSAVRLIDLGAAADLRVGINYVPNEYLLDPRFAPPQQYVMSPLTPRAPPTPLAALLSPVLWRLNQPDRFDMYSVGICIMQMAFAALRPDNGLIAFNEKLDAVDYNLDVWRSRLTPRGQERFADGFALLDADGGAGWRLVTKLVTYKPGQRLSARRALRSPWFDNLVAEAPAVAAARRALSAAAGSADAAVQRVVDAAAATAGPGRAGGLSEVELYAELRRDAGDDAPLMPDEAPPRNVPRTIAWWQERARQQDRAATSPLAGLLNRSGLPSKPQRSRPRLAGSATQRAYGGAPVGDGANGARRNGVSGSQDEGDTAQKPRKGVFDLFDRTR